MFRNITINTLYTKNKKNPAKTLFLLVAKVTFKILMFDSFKKLKY